MCECICEIHSTTNMILCVCYETIAHATSRHMPPCLHAWPCQGVIIVNTRISNCFCSASRGICMCLCVRDKGASIKRVFLGPTLSHFLCKYFVRVRVREMHIILCSARQLDNCPAHYTCILLWWAPLISVSCCLSLLDGSSLSHCMHLMRVSSTIFLLPPNDNDIMLWRVVLCYHMSVISNLSPCVPWKPAS